MKLDRGSISWMEEMLGKKLSPDLLSSWADTNSILRKSQWYCSTWGYNSLLRHPGKVLSDLLFCNVLHDEAVCFVWSNVWNTNTRFGLKELGMYPKDHTDKYGLQIVCHHWPACSCWLKVSQSNIMSRRNLARQESVLHEQSLQINWRHYNLPPTKTTTAEHRRMPVFDLQ